MAKLVREEDGLRVKVLGVSALVGIVLFAVLPFVLDDVSFGYSAAALALPLVCLGVLDLVLARSWFRLAVAVLISAVFCIIGWMFGAVVAMLLLGAYGIASVSDLIQRRWFITFMESAEHLGVRPERTRTDKLVSFMFDLPEDLDMRNMKVRGSIRRESIPWRQMALSSLPTLVVMLVVWIVAAAVMGPGWSLKGSILPVIVASMYAVAITMPLNAFFVMDARAEMSGRTIRLADGLTRTSYRLAIPAAIALVVVLLFGTVAALEVVIASAVFCVALRMIASMLYSMAGESRFVSDAYSEWTRTHPVDLCSGFDGRRSGKGLDDGVPGTPRRPADFALPGQK
ncbi:MAG: hypothetical protein Q4Q58_06075 [Thermoplasmata archaeon]|nr:hypothetical protein [Thermoplasmata archaeon]